MHTPRARFFFLFFVMSGFCGLVYEIVWTRLAMASFGVTTTVVSVMLSLFMLGLAVGSWLAGWAPLLAWLGTGRRFLRAYGTVELGIAVSALAVPWAFQRGRDLMLGLGETASAPYHAICAALLAIAVLPWATLMGATFALALGALRTAARSRPSADGERAFSYLYLANVLGGACGTLLTGLVLVELFGFRGTLVVAAGVNAAIGLAAWVLARDPAFAAEVAPAPAAPDAASGAASDRSLLVVLFVTGLTSMAMELVWTRLFAHYLGTFVYTFAAILFIYLVATYAGSALYRRRAGRGQATHAGFGWATLAALSVLPLVYADERLVPHGYDLHLEAHWLALAIAPFCAALGYLTPLVVDRYSGGSVSRASRAYSVNVLGCILGPLLASYLVLPYTGERLAVLLLALPPLGIGLWAVVRAEKRRWVVRAFALNLAVLGAIGVGFRTYVEEIPDALIRRDHTATVIGHGKGLDKRLFVNGVSMTYQTSITKIMAHLPLAFLEHPPKSALAICFGMGTTFRSLSTWEIRAVAVDLIPSVPTFFGFFFPDIARVFAGGRSEVVIDDGRRYLDRTRAEFDVVTLDPPPPVAAAGSSLLYSREFYQAVKRRLAPGGILQQWIPRGSFGSPAEDPGLISAVVQALRAEFPHVRAFLANDGPGLEFLASSAPLEGRTAKELVARMPAAARADLIEWSPGETPEHMLGAVFEREVSVDELVRRAPGVPPLTDDRPINEYFVVRWALGGVGGSTVAVR